MKKFLRLIAILLCFTAFVTFNTNYNTVFAAEVEDEVAEETEEETNETNETEESAEDNEVDETADNDETDNDETEDDETEETDTQQMPITPFTPPTIFPQGIVVPAVDISTEVITPAAHPTTEIVFAGMPQGAITQLFTVVATSPITNVQTLLLEDNRLAIDILNSTTALLGAQPLLPFSSISEIRVSQFEETVTRAVLDLPSGANFSVSLSPDRLMVQVLIAQNTIQNLTFSVSETFDTIVLTGVVPDNLQVSLTTGILRFNIPNTVIPYEFIIDAAADGNFAQHINLWQITPTMAQLAIAIHEFTAFTLLQTGINETTINLHPTTFRNISYDFAARTFTIPRDADNFNITWANTNLFDDYHQRRAILTLPVMANDHLGFGTKMVGDMMLQSVSILHGLNHTQLVFEGNQIFSLVFEEDEENLTIRVLHPRMRYSRIVMLDPGHGGHDPGAVRGTVRESDLNMQIMQKLQMLIDADGIIRAYTTRNTDVFVPLVERAAMGNVIADIFVSIHHNAANNAGIHGLETFFLTSEIDNFRTLTNRNLADIMHRNLLMMLGSADRGVRPANFSVLRNSHIPAVLLELGFMSNSGELARMQTEEFQWQAARAIYNSLLEAFAMIPAR
ncbi:MAG: N-acetylmuramoyl-L-alanine amidase [Defluviitaleaceae bacterium]|nr:N-acetylmuramoyl-L-alanine amidase [Defluviitaleaceae bacterium]